MKFTNFLRYLGGALIAAHALAASALQVVDVRDQRSHLVKISAKEMTRLSVENAKAVRLDHIDTELEVKRDADTGSYLIIPNTLSKPINVFLTTNTGKTHALILQPSDMPLETVILKEGPTKQDHEARRSLTPIERAGSLQLIIKRLFVAMARHEQPAEFEVTPVNSDLSLWTGTQFTLQRRYVGSQISGEHFVLRNLTKEVIRLSEQELFQAGIAAIAIEKQILGPGESTDVFIARVKNDG